MGETLRDADRAEILRMLQEGMDSLTVALLGIDETSARRRPRADSWSVLECVEHLTLTERALLQRLKEARACEESREDRARETKFQDLALNRVRRIEAPEPVRPANDSACLEQVSEAFKAARSETVRYVEQFQGDLRWWVTQHPLITRPVNCYEMLLLIAMHPKRHALQIVQICRALEGGNGPGES
jgi:uncharacterized damage-inducible protein DinB